MDMIDVNEVQAALTNWQNYAFVAVVLIFGALGGVAQKLSMDISEKPGKIGNYILIGMAAAVAVMMLFIPNDLFRLIAISIIAGFGGKAILGTLADKLKIADISEKAQGALYIGERSVEISDKLGKENAELKKFILENKQALPGNKTNRKGDERALLPASLDQTDNKLSSEIDELTDSLGSLRRSLQGK